jgi:hypothetical protein
MAENVLIIPLGQPSYAEVNQTGGLTELQGSCNARWYNCRATWEVEKVTFVNTGILA